MLDAPCGVLTSSEIIALYPAKLGFLEDVVMGSGGMGTSEIDLSAPLVGCVAKEWDVHVFVLIR